MICLTFLSLGEKMPASGRYVKTYPQSACSPRNLMHHRITPQLAVSQGAFPQI
jgi:hypothetical protein